MREELPDGLLERYRQASVPTVWSALDELHGYHQSFMQGVSSQTPGEMLVARARTLRFIPPRPDIFDETPVGEDAAPEARAMARCGPGDALVCDVSGSRYSSSGGEMKLLQLKMNGAEGIVTDGAVRDLTGVRKLGFKIFAAGGTVAAGKAPFMFSYEANVVIQCGGIAVRPGDLIVGNEDGVVCVPSQWAEEVIDWVEEHDYLEDVIREMVLRDNVRPTTYYNAAMFEKLRGSGTKKAERSAYCVGGGTGGRH